jgi:hypothetical protein
MPFNAVVVRVLVASPGDTGTDRLVVREAMEDWNSLHAESNGVMLLPVTWERDATPEMGERPQGIINRQLVDIADILIGIFWTRLGTPTGEADSGTAEEIERFIEAGKPVSLYFSSQPVAPESVDQAQYARLTEFRRDLEQRGLIDRYESSDELRRKVTATLTRAIRERFVTSLRTDTDEAEAARSVARAVLVAQIEREREISGVDSRGAPRYTTRERLIIQNGGSVAADGLDFSFEAGDADEGSLPFVARPEQPIGRLPPGGSVAYPLIRGFGTVQQWDVVFRWTEGDQEFEERQTLS